jgi:hypothetical protein
MSDNIDMDDEFDRLLDEFISKELQDVEVPEFSKPKEKSKSFLFGLRVCLPLGRG